MMLDKVAICYHMEDRAGEAFICVQQRFRVITVSLCHTYSIHICDFGSNPQLEKKKQKKHLIAVIKCNDY